MKTRKQESIHFISIVNDFINGHHENVKNGMDDGNRSDLEVAKQTIKILFEYQPHIHFKTADDFINSTEFQQYLLNKKKKQIHHKKMSFMRDF
jgi:hypothetical protein